MKKRIYIVLLVLLYAVALFAQNAKQDQSKYYDIHLQNSNIHNVIISPVPMSEPVFYVRSNQLITKIEVINILGKVIYVKNIRNYTFDPIEVDLPYCPYGIYFVKITFDDNTFVIKKTLYR